MAFSIFDSSNCGISSVISDEPFRESVAKTDIFFFSLTVLQFGQWGIFSVFTFREKNL
jgi:hypothetical protein